jgi:hypothetical protein
MVWRHLVQINSIDNMPSTGVVQLSAEGGLSSTAL